MYLPMAYVLPSSLNFKVVHQIVANGSDSKKRQSKRCQSLAFIPAQVKSTINHKGTYHENIKDSDVLRLGLFHSIYFLRTRIPIIATPSPTPRYNGILSAFGAAGAAGGAPGISTCDSGADDEYWRISECVAPGIIVPSGIWCIGCSDCIPGIAPGIIKDVPDL